MNDILDRAAAESKPVFWYGLPRGYRQVDLHPSAEGLEEVVRQIRELPDELRDRADQVFRLYAIVVMMLQKQQVQGCALGMHPDGDGGSALSVLTVSSVSTPGVNPQRVLAEMMASGVGKDNHDGMRPVQLPIGTAFLAESVRSTVGPGMPPDGQGGVREEKVWRGMVAIPDSGSASVITVQMVTAAVEFADDYRGVLLGIARTVTFIDPALAEAAPVAGAVTADPAAEAVKNVFG